MGRFFLVFFVTGVIGYFSIFLAIIAGGLLFFGKYAPFPAPESVPYFVARFVILAINLFPGILFIRWQAKRYPQNPIWIPWLGGLLALSIVGTLSLGFMSFRGMSTVNGESTRA